VTRSKEKDSDRQGADRQYDDPAKFPKAASPPLATSLLTGAGKAAVAVIEVSGDSAGEAIRSCFRPATSRAFAAGQIRYGNWTGIRARGAAKTSSVPDSVAQDGTVQTAAAQRKDPVGEAGAPVSETGAPVSETGAPVSDAEASTAGESVVVLPLAADRFEVHCHGGLAATGRILADLDRLGADREHADREHADREHADREHDDQGRPNRSSSPQPVGCPSHSETDRQLIDEAIETLIACSTKRNAAIAMDQVRGAMVRWRQQVVARLSHDAGSAAEIAQDAERLAGFAALGLHLSRPWGVVLAGPPNVGKSSLINAMVGYDRAITMDLAGTTRDVLDAETVFDGWPLRLRDTAGLHASGESIERQGIERALAAVTEADLVILVGQPGGAADRQRALELIRDRGLQLPVVEVVNKLDQLSADLSVPIGTFGTVATQGTGVEELLRGVLRQLIPKLPEPGQPVPTCERQIAWLQRIAALAAAPTEMKALLGE
jgi:tRNA modification GTPase